MFTDEEIRQLHQDAEYKKANRLVRNFKYSTYAVKNGGGFISLSVNTSPSASISVNLVKLFWFVAKYVFITKELILFRRKIIESILHAYFDKKHDIIQLSLIGSYKWLENNDVKLAIAKKLCIDYLSNVDNRVILVKYSRQNKEVSEKRLIDTISFLEDIFETAIHDYKHNQIYKLSYEYLITLDETKVVLQNMLNEAMFSGNLTSGKGEE